MLWSRKRGARRQEIRKNRPDQASRRWAELRAGGTLGSIWVAIGFCIATTLVMMLRENVIPYHPGEYTPDDITARVGFSFADKDELAKKRQIVRELEPHVFSPNGDIYHRIEDALINLPHKVAKLKSEELEPPLRKLLDAASLSLLQEYASPEKNVNYVAAVRSYMESLRDADPIVLPDDQRGEELRLDYSRSIVIPGKPVRRVDSTFSNEHLDSLRALVLEKAKGPFLATLSPKIADLTISIFKANPSHMRNEQATAAAQNQAAEKITSADAEMIYEPKATIVPRGEITTKGWQLLRAENEAYLSQGFSAWKTRAGTAAVMILMTIMLCGYIARFQPRIVRNQARGMAIAALMFLMLLLAQIAGLGTSPTYVFGIAPTIIVAMILTIVYDQRFAIGLSLMHAAMVTLALNESISFFLVVMFGVLTCCFLLDDIRTRSKLVEVGGVTALALIIASCAASLLQLLPPQFMFRNALYAGAAGLGVGFVVLGILPFIEKAFKITTSMTLLELADASQPLLRRLALEAPGTYNHSLQVATLSEEAAEAIGANSLLCRVGSYYHDIGKVSKPEYFIENQSDGHNRHINLNPNVSYLIIIGHVKDGVAMAKEYHLPTKLLPFIEQHHGTTLVEFFYHRACDKLPPDQPRIAEDQFRYPGPKPKSKEIAIVMLADCVESATRAMTEPTASRIDALVHDLAMKRLQDGQFDECDLTMRELEQIENSLAKSLKGIYHGRIAYPSTQAHTTAVVSEPTVTARSA